MNNIRDIAIVINNYFISLLKKPILINIGENPDDGTADTLEEGLLKIVENLKVLVNQQKDSP
jgi:hypothetical protein